MLEALYLGEPGWASIVKALELATKSGDPAAMLGWADAFTGRQRDGSYDEIAYAFPASECLDTSDESLRHAMAESKRQNAQAPTLGRYFGEDVLCSLWPVRSASTLGKLTAPKAPPLLVIGTKGDPATPYEWAQGMARRLKSAILVTNRGGGHTSYHNRACVEGVVVPYLADGKLPASGTTC